MELKRNFVRQMTGRQKCLNCTVMELKLTTVVISVPISNCLNCTVMELKLIYSYRLILRSGS